jgi:hypothetical protein
VIGVGERLAGGQRGGDWGRGRFRLVGGVGRNLSAAKAAAHVGGPNQHVQPVELAVPGAQRGDVAAPDRAHLAGDLTGLHALDVGGANGGRGEEALEDASGVADGRERCAVGGAVRGQAACS